MEGYTFESHEKPPAFEDLTIFTATLYGDDETSKVRQALALKLFENIEKLAIACVVIDGGSNEDFLTKVRAHKNIILRINTELGMGASRREALRIAIEECPDANSDHYFMWVEPEKDGLITVENLEKMLAPLRDDSTDIVVPARENMDTLPQFQAQIEQRANKRVKELIQEPSAEVWDIWFGPKVFNREGSKYFLNYTGALDKWDSVMKPVLDAFKDGKRIASVPVDFSYDESQRANEDNNDTFKEKRIEQYATVLAEMGDPFWKHKLAETKTPKD